MLAQRVGPGGAKAIIAESVLLKHQQLIAPYSVAETPGLITSDRFLCGFLVLFMHLRHVRKAAVAPKPATLARFHGALLSRRDHRLFSSRNIDKPGLIVLSDDLVRVIAELERRNARFRCPRIAQQIYKAFGFDIHNDLVRRVLAKHYRPTHRDGGPSGLTVFRHTGVSLWSTALFQRISIFPNIHSSFLAIGHAESQNFARKEYIGRTADLNRRVTGNSPYTPPRILSA